MRLDGSSAPCSKRAHSRTSCRGTRLLSAPQREAGCSAARQLGTLAGTVTAAGTVPAAVRLDRARARRVGLAIFATCSLALKIAATMGCVLLGDVCASRIVMVPCVSTFAVQMIATVTAIAFRGAATALTVMVGILAMNS